MDNNNKLALEHDIFELIKNCTVKNIRVSDKYICLEFDKGTKLEVEVELPTDCKMAVHIFKTTKIKYAL